jgi:hypothetical protein
MCCSSAQREQFLLFLCQPLCVALRESPPGTLSKNRSSNGLYDRFEEWLPTNDGRFVHFDLLLRTQPLDASFCITLSRSRLDSSSSSQMTTVHPIPESSPRYPRLSGFLLGVLLSRHAASDFHDFASDRFCNDISAFHWELDRYASIRRFRNVGNEL